MEAVEPKMGRIKRSWLLTKGAWHAFRLDKEMIALPIFANILSLILVIVGAFVVWYFELYTNFRSAEGGEIGLSPAGLVAGFVFFALISGVGTFFGGAMAHAALARYNGQDPSLRSSLQAAWRKRGALIGFGILTFGIMQTINAIAERIPFIGGKIMAVLAGAAWNVAAFFALPVIMNEADVHGPYSAVKRSVGIVKRVWGESLVISAGISVIALIVAFAYISLSIAMVVALWSLGLATSWVPFTIGLLAVLGIIAMTFIISVLEAYARAAIYHYATTGISPVSFNEQLLRSAFSPKKARKLFV